MTYTSVDEVPFNIRRCFSPEDLINWMTEYNAAMASLEDGTLNVPDSRISKATHARRIAFENCKYLPSSRYVMSVATTEVVDRQNELADVDSYFDAMYDFIENGGGVGIDSHSSKNASIIWGFEKGVDEKTGRPAIVIYENFYRGTKLYDNVWKAVLDGFLGEKSIGSRIDADKSHFECDADGCYNKIYADQIFEISSVMRGANPRTYIVDKHVAEKGSDFVTYISEINNTKNMCTLKENYLNFKNEIAKCSPDAIVHYLPNGSIYIKGYLSSMERAVSNYYPDRYASDPIEIPGLGDFTFITKLKGEYDVNLVFDEVMIQIDGEREAISGYNDAIAYINDIPNLPDDVKENVSNILREIIGDEQKHIGSLYQALKVICPRIKENLHDGKEEAKEIVEKSDEVSPCPEGQHEHAGVSGCHDVTRDHSGQGSETLPSTSQSSEPRISLEQMSTEQLLSNLTAMRDTLNNYSSEQVRQFLATPNGKAYIQMYLELRSRTRASDNSEGKKMSEIVEKSDLVEKSDKAEVALKEDAKEAEVKTVAAPSETVADVTGTPDVTEKPAPIPEVVANSADSTSEGEMPSAIPEVVSGSSEVVNEADGDVALKSDSDLPTAVANISSILVYLKAKIDTFDARLSGLEDMVKMNSSVNDAGIPNPIAEAAAPIGEMAQQIAQPEPVGKEDANADVPVADSKDEVGEEPAKIEDEKDEEKSEVPEEKSEEAPKEEPKSDVESEGKPEEKKDEEKPSEEPKPAEKPEEKSEDDKKKDVREKSAELTLEDYLAMSAFEKRQVDLRAKGIEVTQASGNPESLASVGTTIKAGPGVSIVETPAPEPFTPAPIKSSGYSFDKVMQDMEQMSKKQFSQEIFRGEIPQ